MVLTRINGVQDLDKRLNDAVGPIRQKENELSTIRADFQRDEAAAARQQQAYNKSTEQLDLNKREIKRYVSLPLLPSSFVS